MAPPTLIPRPARFRVSGGEPASVRAADAANRLAYWRAFVEFAKEAKARELARGLDRFGREMAPLAAATIANRRSAMGPADPLGPALQPAHGLSRTRSLFAGEATPDGAIFGWLVDPHTGKPWGRILQIHRKGDGVPVRDVIGLSPASLADARRRAAAWWEDHLAGRATPPTADTPTFPDGRPKFLVDRVPPYVPKNPANAVPKANRRIGQVEINGDVYTMQGGSAAQIRRMIANGTFSGPQTRAQVLEELRRLRSGGPPSPPPAPPPIPPRPPKPKPGPARPAGRPDLARKPRRPPTPPPAFPESQAAVTIHGGEDARAALARLLGDAATDRALASLVGAPDAATVEVRPDPAGDVLRYAVGHPAFRAFFGSIERVGDAIVHRIEDVEIHPDEQARGIGARVHGRQVHWGAALGLDRLTLRAARTDEKFGHLVWPQFGYDGPIAERIRGAMPERLRRFATLQDLLADDDGADWWQAEGLTIALTFDLKPGSRSIALWNRYWTRKALDPAGSP